jgi:hypothetical protein
MDQISSESVATSPSAAHEPLSYAGAGSEQPSRALYRTALLCGGIPLITGTSILPAFAVTRKENLIIAGMLTIVAGFFAFLVGSVALVRYARDERRRLGSLEWHSGPGRRCLLTAALLLANFPVAYVCEEIGSSLIPWWR